MQPKSQRQKCSILRTKLKPQIKQFLSNISRCKQVDQSDFAKTEFARCLTALDLTALGVGSTLGSGVYVVVGTVAKTLSGPGVVLSFLIAAIASILAGLCYAEFGARVPRTGSAYLYSYVAVGELMAFTIGWNLILEYVIGSAGVARAYTMNFDGMTGGRLSNYLATHLPLNTTGMAQYVDPIAFSVSVLLSAILALGVELSSTFTKIFTTFNLGVILYVVICGMFKADIANWRIDPAKVGNLPPNSGEVGNGGFLPFGFTGVLAGAGTCFYSFVGFDAIATTGEEVKNPQRDLPISIIICLLVCFVAYASVSSIVTLMVPYFLIPDVAPLASVFATKGWWVANYTILGGAFFALSTSLMGAMFPLPRVLYAMATDGLLFRFIGKVHPRFKTPLLATLLSGLLAGLMAAFFGLDDLVEMMSIGTLLAYTLVALSVLLLRGRCQAIGGAVKLRLVGSVTHIAPGLIAIQDRIENSADRVDGNCLNPEQQLDTSNSVIAQYTSDEMRPDTSTDSARPSFSLYLQLCFRRQPGQIHPSRTSEWIYTTNAYLMVTSIVLTNFGILYFESHSVESSNILLALSVIAIVLFGSISLLLCISLQLQPENQHPVTFKVPGVAWVAAASSFVNTNLMLKLSTQTWIRFGVWMIVGFFIYFGYGYWQSSERIRSIRKTSLIEQCTAVEEDECESGLVFSVGNKRLGHENQEKIN